MAVSPDDFKIANGKFTSLAPLTTAGNGWITAIAVTIQGVVGGEHPIGRNNRMQYRLLASVKNLESGLPTMWVASPLDLDIKHVNIFRPRSICPFVGTMLPQLCWGTCESAWMATKRSERTLANLLEVTQQVLAQVNMSSRAR